MPGESAYLSFGFAGDDLPCRLTMPHHATRMLVGFWKGPSDALQPENEHGQPFIQRFYSLDGANLSMTRSPAHKRTARTTPARSRRHVEELGYLLLFYVFVLLFHSSSYCSLLYGDKRQIRGTATGTEGQRTKAPVCPGGKMRPDQGGKTQRTEDTHTKQAQC